MRIDGGCHCGFVTYEAEIDPDDVGICHCSDCQALTGTAFRVSVFAPRNKFQLLSGDPATYVKVADSGAKRVQAFCPKCGSPIYATSLDDPSAGYGIRTGTVHQRDSLVPQRQIWARSEQHWIAILASIPRFDQEPPD